MEHGNRDDASFVRKAIEKGGLESIEGVVSALQRSDAIAYTRRVAQGEADKALAALSVLPASTYRQSLEDLAKYSIERSY